ncbi:MAG: spiro-SPASM protein [Leptospirales bacterium]|nr:spiro-SPASM protein [Leptospirales bacterium]
MPGKIQAVAIHCKKTPPTDLLRETLSNIARVFPGLPVFSNVKMDGVKQLDTATAFQTARTAYAQAAALQPLGEDDGIALFEGLAPFLDEKITADLTAVHLQYIAHCTYCENLPAGFAPDLLSADFLADVPEPGPTGLRDFIFKNIEKYDAEILFRPPDLRQFRLDFSGMSPRSLELIRSVKQLKADLRYEGLQSLLLANPGVMRPFPSYVEIGLTSYSPVKPILFPELSSPGHLAFDLIEKIDREIRAQSWDGDTTVCLGGWGEPLLHPEIDRTLELLLSNPGIQTVYLETYGADLGQERLDRWKNFKGIERLALIVRLSTLKRDRYSYLYGADLFEKVIKNVENLEKMERPFSVYVEMLKIKEVEEELTPFYDRFEKSSIGIILNKYNSYAGELPERRVSDLTPLHRDFCWHLARDVFITPEGKVPLCKQNPSGTKGPVQDLAQSSLVDIWKGNAIHHAASVRGDHAAIPMPCLSCDEWYTFNG